MATYAIGDVQGCYDQLRRLLDQIVFEPGRDHLWFVGDLVNRGLQSLEILRFVKGLERGAVTTLGNHDLHLLVVAEGFRKPHRSDTLDAVLSAPDRDELLAWLRQQRMIYAEAGYVMVHAGLLPQWTVAQAIDLAREVESALSGENWREFLRHMYGNEPSQWRDDLAGYDRLRVVVNAMTRMRLCTADGVMEFSHKTGPRDLPAGFMPWYEVPNRASRVTPIISGHWAALGLMMRPDVLAIDTGCVWGRSLSAVRLEDRTLYQCDCGKLKGTALED